MDRVPVLIPLTLEGGRREVINMKDREWQSAMSYEEGWPWEGNGDLPCAWGAGRRLFEAVTGAEA